MFAQRIGLSLEEISAELHSLPTDRPPTNDDWAKISARWLTQVDRKIEEMQKLRTGLTRCIGCGCLSFDYCSMANKNDRVARNGPGPRFWV